MAPRATRQSINAQNSDTSVPDAMVRNVNPNFTNEEEAVAGAAATATSENVKLTAKGKHEPKAKAKPGRKPKNKAHVLPHGLGLNLEEAALSGDVEQTLAVKEEIVSAVKDNPDALKKAWKPKKPSQYGIKLHVSPWPDIVRPTHEECQNVHDILTKAHGEIKPPTEDFDPSLMVAGCGDVKFVIDALMRTLISAHTTMANANMAMVGLVKKFGVLDGLHKNTTDWNKVRLASQPEVEAAIRSGGMAPKKSREIKMILDMVYEENQLLRTELLNPSKSAEGSQMIDSMQHDLEFGTKEDGKVEVKPEVSSYNPKFPIDPALKDSQPKSQDTESTTKTDTLVYHQTSIMESTRAESPLEVIQRASEWSGIPSRDAVMAALAVETLRDPSSNILTLDYMHVMTDESIFNKFLCYPSIGVKTAACTMLFCLRRPFFAVDTHVFRLCKWLNWVPENANRDTTFAHCDVRMKDELKYGMHQLMIKHGQNCEKCRAVTGESSAGWETECVLEKLLTRTGKKKGGVDAPKKRKKGGDVVEGIDDDDDDLKPKKTRKTKANTGTDGLNGDAAHKKGRGKKNAVPADTGEVEGNPAAEEEDSPKANVRNTAPPTRAQPARATQVTAARA